LEYYASILLIVFNENEVIDLMMHSLLWFVQKYNDKKPYVL